MRAATVLIAQCLELSLSVFWRSLGVRMRKQRLVQEFLEEVERVLEEPDLRPKWWQWLWGKSDWRICTEVKRDMLRWFLEKKQ